MADAEMAHGAGAAGRPDEHGWASGPLPRPGSDGEHAVQQWLGTTQRADRFYDHQVLGHLNERMQEFAQSQEMFFLATSDRHGECDNTFRAGPPGFLRVLDERTLIYPEYRGNGVHASLGNLQENPHVGILLMDFMRARIGLHVNGRAEICEDAVVRREYPDLPVDPVPGRRAQLWVKVQVEEAYIHCAKHIPHLQKVPRGAGREWGTDDHKRKGGDFFGAARDARERGPVEWQPREHEAPPSRPQDPVPASVQHPGQVPPPPSVPPAVAPPAPPAPVRAPVQAPAPAPAYGRPRHARSHPEHQTPVAAWQAAPEPPAQAPAPYSVPPLPGVPPQSTGLHTSGPHTTDAQPNGGPVPNGAQGPGPHSAGRHSPGSVPPGSVPPGSVPAGVGAAVGASAVIAARAAVPEGEDAEAWRQEAERALADAQQRAADEESSSFQGWFG